MLYITCIIQQIKYNIMQSNLRSFPSIKGNQNQLIGPSKYPVWWLIHTSKAS